MTDRVVDTRVVSCEVPQSITEVETYRYLNVHRPYSMHITGTIVPQRVDIRWEKVNDGLWQLIRLSVTGPKVKKDGTLGLNSGTTWFMEGGREWLSERPDWIQAMVDQWEPVGAQHE